MHHVFVIEAEAEQGIEIAQEWAKRELDLKFEQNPDVIILRYGLFSVEDARAVVASASQAPFRGAHKVIIISASRAYHEAQNALLKLFEEPPPGTYLFLILSSLGGLLPTLRSRVQELSPAAKGFKSHIDGETAEFVRGTKERRSAMIKKLTSGGDEDERRENREEAIGIVNGIEAAAYQAGAKKHLALLGDIQTLRGHLYDRSAPLKMILEHLALVVPKTLV